MFYASFSKFYSLFNHNRKFFAAKLKTSSEIVQVVELFSHVPKFEGSNLVHIEELLKVL